MKPWQGLILNTYSGEGVLVSEHFTDSYEIVLPSSTPLRPTARRYDLLELHLSVYSTDLTYSNNDASIQKGSNICSAFTLKEKT